MNRLAGKSKSSKSSRSNKAFYLDEGGPVFIAMYLRSEGCNVTTVPPYLRGASDVAQVIQAAKAGRIFVAVDKDVSGYTFPVRRIIESPGVNVITSASASSQHYQILCRKLLKFLDGSSIAGKLCLVSDGGVRIKKVVE